MPGRPSCAVSSAPTATATATAPRSPRGLPGCAVTRLRLACSAWQRTGRGSLRSSWRRGRAGAEAVSAATAASAAAVPVGSASGVLVRTPLLSVLLVVARFRHRTFLLTGAVTPALLERAGVDMLASLTAGPR